jgi:ABC-type multidrug transport system ATPase subunit
LRSSIGFCPQHDVLYDGLTPKEHLTLLGTLKSDRMGAAFDGTEVERLLEETCMTFKENEPVGTLSGGQKRRLSVAVSLIGSPAVCVLDEPTT